jgi:hypothetical protein
LLLPAIALAADKPAPAPRFDPWTIIGPGGGTIIAPTISPQDPRIVVELSRCRITGYPLVRAQDTILPHCDNVCG